MLREFLTAELLPVIGRLTTHPDAPLRASLVTAQLIGIASSPSSGPARTRSPPWSPRPSSSTCAEQRGDASRGRRGRT
jgi:hypothetical protein